MSNRRTLKDIAKAAGVSEMTVSRVMRHSGVVSAGTTARVQSAIESMGYVPNRLAGSLAHARSNQVAVIIPSLVNNVFSRVLAGVTQELEKADYNAVVGISDYNIQKEEKLVMSMMSWRPAGIIVTSLLHTDRTRNILANAGIPVVEIMDIGDEPIDMAVGLNHAKAVAVLIEHLLDKGYRNLGYLGWNTNDFPAARRFSAIKDCLEAKGYGFTAPEIYSNPPDAPAGKEGMRKILADYPETDIVVFSNDTAAMGGMLHCLEAGLRMPQDVAVAGFSGLRASESLPKPLTTVRTRRFETGRIAARNILNRLAGQDVNKVVDLGFELIPGASS